MEMLPILLLLILSTITNALPNGAPISACRTMLPFHNGGIERQYGSSPFGVYAIRRKEDVLVSVGSPIELPFGGLMLQARISDGSLGGTFEPIKNDVHIISCEKSGDTITHNEANGKPGVQVKWKPPPGYIGPVIFNATVAQDYSTFWVGIESQSLQISRDFDKTNNNQNIPTPPNVAVSTSPHFFPEESTSSNKNLDPFYDGCADRKLCFGTPDGCLSQRNCKAAVAVTVLGGRYEFEMKATGSPAWVGTGLSFDNQMGNDSVIECVKEDGSVKAYMSWTTPRPKLGVSRLPSPQQGITLLNGSSIDDTLYCKVVRDAVTSVNTAEFDLVNSEFYLLIAAGSSLKPNSVGFHDLGYLPSSNARYLSDVSNVAGASKILIRLHGALMLAAWIGTASLGTFIARYYRKTWSGKTLCGKDLWFAWHRLFMVATWALTSVAFILIFLELRAWSTENNPHAILGCVVTILCFMQPIGAFFRPHPGTPKRPIFNWLHWFGGNSAHIISIITIFFAIKLNKAELPEWFDWILAAFVIFHVLMHLVLSILSCISDNSSNQRVTAFPMKDLTSSDKLSGQAANSDGLYSGARKFMLGLYILIVGALTTSLIIITVLAPIEELMG